MASSSFPVRELQAFMSGSTPGSVASSSSTWPGSIVLIAWAGGGLAVEHARSLHVQRSGEAEGWQLCPEHAVQFLNQLRTVEPKLSVDTLSLAGDWRANPGGSGVSPEGTG